MNLINKEVILKSYIKYWNRDIKLLYTNYKNKENICIIIESPDPKENEEGPIAVATTWIPGLAKDEVAIKDYSENEGVEKTLRHANIIGQIPLRTVKSGFVNVNIYKLTENYEQKTM